MERRVVGERVRWWCGGERWTWGGGYGGYEENEWWYEVVEIK